MEFSCTDPDRGMTKEVDIQQKKSQDAKGSSTENRPSYCV